MVSFVGKDGKRKMVPTLTASAKKAADKKAAEKRKRKRRMARLRGMSESNLYPVARGHFGVNSPRVATAAGRPIQRGLQQRAMLQKRFMRELQRDPVMAQAFLSEMYSRRR